MKKSRLLVKICAVALAAMMTGCTLAPAAKPAEEAISSDSMRALVNMPTDFEAVPGHGYEYPAANASVNMSAGATSIAPYKPDAAPEEMRAVWISYLEMATLLKNKSKTEFTANISDVFDKVKAYGLNTVVVHVRPFGDALYDSEYFPWSYTITGVEGKDPGYDPLEIMIKQAHARGLRFEAWLNPYRVRNDGNTNAMSADNPARIALEAGDGSVVKYKNVISYNPASAKSQKLILNGVREIVRKYDVDAIHIDDYFYPTTDEAFDKNYYTAYTDKGGELSLADWRRDNVLKMVRGMYKAVKDEKPEVLFGISPQSSIDNNYSTQYLDVKKITSVDGYCDYIMPQIYFGFDNQAQPYAKTLALWSNMVKAPGVRLYVGLGVYKCGLTDSWAGTGKSEWADNNDLLAQMVKEARSLENCTGFALYRYESLFVPAEKVQTHVKKEAANLKKIL